MAETLDDFMNVVIDDNLQVQADDPFITMVNDNTSTPNGNETQQPNNTSSQVGDKNEEQQDTTVNTDTSSLTGTGDNDTNSTKQEEDTSDNVFGEIASLFNAGGNVNIEVTEETTEEEFWESVNKAYEEKVVNSLGYVLSDDALNVYEYLSNGGTLDSLTTHLSNNKNYIKNIDLTTEEGQKQTVEAYYQSKGFEGVELQMIVDALVDNGTIADKATELYTVLEQQYNERNAELFKQQEEARQLQVRQQQDRIKEAQQLRTDTQKHIRTSGEILGVKLTAKEKRQFEDYLFKEKDHKLPDGRTVRMTDAEMKRHELQQDRVNYILALAYLEMNGFDLGTITKTSKSAVKNNKGLSKYKSIINKQRTNKPKGFKRESIDDVFST